jgi:hypothetical protein
MLKHAFMFLSLAALTAGCATAPPASGSRAAVTTERLRSVGATRPAHEFRSIGPAEDDGIGGLYQGIPASQAADSAKKFNFIVTLESRLVPLDVAKSAEKTFKQLQFETLRPTGDVLCGLCSANSVNNARFDITADHIAPARTSVRLEMNRLTEPQARLVADAVLDAIAEAESAVR